MSPIQVIARIAVWALSFVLIIVGINFISTVTGVNWTCIDDTCTSGEPYDLIGPGTALLSVGLLVLAALLIIEAYRPRVSGSVSTPDA